MKNCQFCRYAVTLLASALFVMPSVADTKSVRSEFRQVGYLKDKVNNRIFTFAMPGSVNAASVRAHAERLPYTPGQMTGAYYFPEGAKIPADGITLAGNVVRANQVLFDTPGVPAWRFAYQRSFNGASTLIDCGTTTSEPLCR